MSAIDTSIDADVPGTRLLSDWLRRDLGSAIDSATASLRYAREDRGTWIGTAGDAFRGRMSTLSGSSESASARTSEMAAGLERFADVVADAQIRMEGVRSEALAAGLTVTATAIVAPSSPGPIPLNPGLAATPAEAQSFERAANARRTAVARCAAFDSASAEVESIREDVEEAERALASVEAAVKTLLIPAVDFVTGAGISAVVGRGAIEMRGYAALLRQQANSFAANAARPGSALTPGLFYRDLDDAARAAAQATTVADDASKLVRAGKVGGVVVGAVLTGFSIHSDIEAGESTTQAVVSNGGGLIASIVAGAAAGTAIGGVAGSIVPGAGNVVGAVGGAIVGGVVGIFTSGAIDGLFEHDLDVGEALKNGWNDLKDTGAAIGDLAVDGVEAVGDMIGRAGDGLSDAWDAVFG